jgi:flagellar P-ring protein precursor FlgI
MQVFLRSLLTLCILPWLVAVANADRIKDITSLAGIRSNQLVGYGIVVGLAGSGDGNTGITLQSMQSLVARFGITSEVDGFNGDNAAAGHADCRITALLKAGTNY